MIKDENGVLVGYVFADIDQTQRDLGGWVDDAKTIVASQLALPAGTGCSGPVRRVPREMEARAT